MKTRLAFSILLALSVVLAACSPGQQTAQPCSEITPETGGALPDLQGCTLRVAVENAYNPFNFIDETTGEGIGYDYDLFRDACSRLNCTAEFVATSWDTILAVMGGQAEADTFDVAADGITITPERAEHVDFSIPYIALAQQLLVRADETRFTDVESLKAVIAADPEVRLGAQPGTTNYDLTAETFGADKIVTFDQYGLIVEALINGDIDAMLIDNVSGEGYIGSNPGEIKLTGEPLTSEELGFAFPKGSALVDPINQAIEQMEADGKLDEIYAKWFSNE
jgi:polar amino acid transport system substrate-binding protein